MPDQNIASLIDRLLAGVITPEEKQFLAQWIHNDSHEEELQSLMEKAWRDFKPEHTLPAAKAGQLLEAILHKAKEEEAIQAKAEETPIEAETPIEEETRPPIEAPIRRIRRIRPYQIAAAILLFVILTGAGLYFLNKTPAAVPQALAAKDVLPPSATKAVLTLADGSNIVLDSAAKGNIAIQHSTAVIKQGDGDIAYQAAGNAAEIEYNTLTVPRGSRIAHLTLADGTRVWLNAGSSLRYPVAFNGPDRNVAVTGESYFEVAPDKSHPFIVTKGKNTIKVLGTHFNVNAYDEEGPMKVTLLEGSVKVSTGNDNGLLLPGQMAIMDAGQRIDVLKGVDLERVMAWKNGYFNFSNVDIRTVMRELSRWYGLELEFNNVTNERFHVEISRDIPLSKVLRILELTDKIHFDISGKKVTVKP